MTDAPAPKDRFIRLKIQMHPPIQADASVKTKLFGEQTYSKTLKA